MIARQIVTWQTVKSEKTGFSRNSHQNPIAIEMALLDSNSKRAGKAWKMADRSQINGRVRALSSSPDLSDRKKHSFLYSMTMCVTSLFVAKGNYIGHDYMGSQVKTMPRGKYDRQKAKEARDRKNAGEPVSPIETPDETPIEIPSESPPSPPIEERNLSKVPRGICKCGHKGDGMYSEHNDSLGASSVLGDGLGECDALDCPCKEFDFSYFTEYWKMKGSSPTPASKKAMEKITKKLTANAVIKGQEKWAEAGVKAQGERDAVSGAQGDPATGVLVSLPSPDQAASPPIKEPVICDGTPKYEPESVDIPGLYNHALQLNPLPYTKPSIEKELGKIDAKLERVELKSDGGDVLSVTPFIKFGEGRIPTDKDIQRAREILMGKGFKVLDPPIPHRPVYYLVIDHIHKTASMTVTLTTKEEVKITLNPPSTIGEAKDAPLEPFVTISNIEDGISLQDARRIARGIRKIARIGENNDGGSGRESEQV